MQLLPYQVPVKPTSVPKTSLVVPVVLLQWQLLKVRLVDTQIEKVLIRNLQNVVLLILPTSWLIVRTKLLKVIIKLGIFF